MADRFLAVAVAAFAAGCAASPPPGDPYVYLTPDAGVSAEPTVFAAEAPLRRASIRLVNPTGVDRPVIQTTEWNDAAGLPVPTLLSAPQRLTVPRFGDATIHLIAPNPTAVQFRVRVESDRSAIDPY
jgi:uncharacterized protein YcfL